jgi:hypothetical protein
MLIRSSLAHLSYPFVSVFNQWFQPNNTVSHAETDEIYVWLVLLIYMYLCEYEYIHQGTYIYVCLFGCVDVLVCVYTCTGVSEYGCVVYSCTICVYLTPLV